MLGMWRKQREDVSSDWTHPLVYIIRWNGFLAIAQYLSGTQHGIALDVVHAAEAIDSRAVLACDG